MKTITLEQFKTQKNARKQRISVNSKLTEFLTSTIKTLEKNKAYVIDVKEFADADVADVHYYSVLKALRNFDKVIDYDITMSTSNRCNAISIVLK
jgi:hypothetical protein